MSELIVEVQLGSLRGCKATTSSGFPYSSFLGVPYAMPPVGPLRFRDPQPLNPWSGIYNAAKEGSACAQSDVFVQKKDYLGEEDCLHLNVYTPHQWENDSKAALGFPVMFWIHGGGYFSGSGSADLFGPEYLLEKNVVVVTINYRLGVFGFLNLGTPEVPGNAGLKDVVAALRWVKQNINTFGGDPDNVTIFGESAGGAIVQFLMISKMSQGLFHKAISQSGSCLCNWALFNKMCLKSEMFKSNKAEYLTELLGSRSTDANKILEVLRSAPAETLVKLARKTQADEESKRDAPFPFSPTVETVFPGQEAFLSKDPLKSWQAGEVSQVPFISGYTSGEGILWAMILKTYPDYLKTYDDNLQYFVPLDFNFPLDSLESLQIADAARKFYLGDKPLNVENIYTYFDILTDYTILQKTLLSAKLFYEVSSTNAYFYKFSFDGDLNFFKKHHDLDYDGAAHEDELTYLFEANMMDLRTEKDSRSDIVRQQMVTMWTNFAKTGNPTPSKTELLPVIWEPINSRSKINYLDINASLEMKTDPESK